MHQEALTKDGQRLFSRLKNFSDFYLAGGTALALQIGHRVSVDFDLFCQNDIPKELSVKIKKIFFKEKISLMINNPEELTVLVNGVKITYIKYPFPVINKFIEFGGFKMLDILELSATKAYTIGRRGSFKDYIDLYFVLEGEFTSLEKIIKLAENKYKTDFNSRLFLEQLIYLKDVEEEKLLFLKKPLNKKQLEDFFIGEMKKISI